MSVNQEAKRGYSDLGDSFVTLYSPSGQLALPATLLVSPPLSPSQSYIDVCCVRLCGEEARHATASLVQI